MSQSKSDSASTNSTTSNTVDKRVAADNGAIVLGDGAKLETMSDDVALGAINAMLDATKTGAALASKTNSDALSFAENASGQSQKIQIEALDTVREANSSALGLTESLSAIMQKNAQPATDTNNTALYIAGGIAAIAVGAVLLKK